MYVQSNWWHWKICSIWYAMFVTTASWVVKTHWHNKVTNGFFLFLQFPVNCLFTNILHSETNALVKGQNSWYREISDVVKHCNTERVFIITSGWCSCILYVCFRSNYMPNGRCHRKWKKNKSFKINGFTKTSKGRTDCSIFFAGIIDLCNQADADVVLPNCNKDLLYLCWA